MKKVLFLIIVSLLLAGVANAVDTTWAPVSLDPNFPDPVANWNVAANWNTGNLPTAADKVFVRVAATECQVTDAQFSASADLGNDQVLRIMNGGDLSSSGWFAVGYSNNAHMIVERDGVSNMASHLWMAANAASTNCILDINGGTVDVDGNIGLGTINASTPSGGFAFLNVNAGLLDLDHWNDVTSIHTGSVLDISFGTVKITGETSDQSDEAAILIGDGRITGFGGATTPTAVYAGGVTTITAPDPMDRYPTMDEWVKDGSLTMTWTNLDPVSPATNVYVDIWFGTNPDDPCNYLKILSQGFQMATGSFGTSTVPGTYYWEIDTYAYGNPATTDYKYPDDPNQNPWDPRPTIIVGDQIVFYATDDSPPSVVINTLPTVTWADEPTTLTATITDDDVSDVTIVWTSDKDPNATFNPPSTTYTQGTVTYPLISTTEVTVDSVENASHQFTVTATVNDLVNLGNSATLGLDCADNPCQAARAVMGYDRDGDVDENCVVEMSDLLRLVADWLAESYALIDPTVI